MTGGAALLASLQELGVMVALNAVGDGLTLTGKGRPPAALLDEVRAAKVELLEVLKRPAKKEAERPTPQPPTLPDTRAAEVVTKLDNLSTSPSPVTDPPDVASAQAVSAGHAAPDWAALSQQVGHCGSCAHFTLSPVWGPYLGECSAPARSWWPHPAPLSIHMGHACAIEGAAGYRSALSGKTYGPRPLEARP